MSASRVCAKWRADDAAAEAEAAVYLSDADGWGTVRRALTAVEQTPGGKDIRDHSVSVHPGKWRPVNAILPSGVWAAAKISRSDCFDVATAGTDWELFCASFVFGYGDVGVGPARFQKIVNCMLAIQTATCLVLSRHGVPTLPVSLRRERIGTTNVAPGNGGKR